MRYAAVSKMQAGGMRGRRWLLSLLIATAFAGSVYTQDGPAVPVSAADTAQARLTQSVAKNRSSVPNAYSSEPINQAANAIDNAGPATPAIADSARRIPYAAAQPGASPIKPSAPPPAKKEPPRKIKLIKRDFNFREQIIMAVCMMFFVVLMMNTAQALNPD